MSPIELFLRIVAMIAIIMAIVFIEMVGIAIVETISREMIEENNNNNNKIE